VKSGPKFDTKKTSFITLAAETLLEVATLSVVLSSITGWIRRYVISQIFEN